VPRVSYHRASSGGGGGLADSVAFSQIESEGQKYVIGMTEEVVAEGSINFDLLSSVITDLLCHLTALTKQSGGATGTYRVRIGGTIGAADGTIVNVLDTTNAAYTLPPDTAVDVAFTRPTGTQLVKLTARSSAAGTRASIRGYEIMFVSA
jgi:hypothetical protein